MTTLNSSRHLCAPTVDAPNLRFQLFHHTSRCREPESHSPHMLRRHAEFSANPAVHPVKLRRMCQVRKCRVKLDAQVETPEYESNPRTTFISRQEVFFVEKQEGRLSVLAERIRKTRRDLRLGQVEFAKKLGLDQTTISKWERARARPLPEALVKIASLVDGVDKLFFLEFAGLPKEYLMGEPMLTEIKEASQRVVAGTRSASKKPAPISLGVTHTTENPIVRWDSELMEFVIETVDGELKKRSRKLSARKFAKVIVLVYEFCQKSGQRDFDMVKRFLDAA